MTAPTPSQPVSGADASSAAACGEGLLIERLRKRYGRIHRNGPWSGPRFITASHVKVDPSFDLGIYGTRIADFMAIDTWRSGNYAVHGFEIKVTRSDWLSELRDPEKADAFKRFCDSWWLVVSDASVVRDDLPTDWGLLVRSGRGLRVAVEAPQLTPEPLPRTVLAGLARSIAKGRGSE